MSSTFQALGWTLIHFCWQATAVSALYLAVDLSFKKARSQTRYLLTLVTLLSMFILSLATLAYEAVNCSSETAFQASTIGALAANVEHLAKQSAHLQLEAVLPWIDFAWVLGVLCFCLRSIGGWWWLQRLRRGTREKAPEAIHATFLKVCARLGITRLPDLRISERISVPMTFGVLRSLVLLPASALLALSPDQLEAILAHELAHVRRADYFWNLLQTMAETLFFFHPAVWWIGRRLREQRELCCDDIAVEMCSDPLIYATALFRLEDQRSAGMKLAIALDGHQSRGNFRARILRVLGEAIPQPDPHGLRPLLLLAVCAGLFLFLSPPQKVLGSISSQHSHERQMFALQKTLSRKPANAEFLSLQTASPTSKTGKIAEEHGPKAQSALPHQGTRNRTDEPPPHIDITSWADEPPPHIGARNVATEPPPHIDAVNLAAEPPPHI